MATTPINAKLAQPPQAASPTFSRPLKPGSGGRKRNVSVAALDSSPGDDENAQRRRHSTVKRACNECRQQKLKCDVVAEDGEFKACSRCDKHKLHCEIDPEFKRRGKRLMNMENEKRVKELEHENRQLRQELARAVAISQPFPMGNCSTSETTTGKEINDLGAHEAAASRSLLDLSQGMTTFPEYTSSEERSSRSIGDLPISRERATRLFNIYFAEYHSFIPLPFFYRDPEHCCKLSPLLYWVIISIAIRRLPSNDVTLEKLQTPLTHLIWDTIREVPQNYHVVKALVSTGYGQPSATLYDWTHNSNTPTSETTYSLPDSLRNRLLVERFCNKVTKALYSNIRDPVGMVEEVERASIMSILDMELQQLEAGNIAASPIDLLHLQAARLHLRLSAFFDPPTAMNYNDDLLHLYSAATTFLTSVLSLDNQGFSIKCSTNYIMQMMLAGGFTLLKLLNSSFAAHVDFRSGSTLCVETIRAIRLISVTTNDLPQRLAEVMAQMWRGSQAGSRRPSLSIPSPEFRLHNFDGSHAIDGSLQLKVKYRMSMSLVFDSVWRWREEFGRTGNLDKAVNNPTDPEPVTTSGDLSTEHPGPMPNALGATSGLDLSDPSMPFNTPFNFFEAGYSLGYGEVFDPLSMLDNMYDPITGQFPGDGTGIL
ncbi:hypothetical protein B0A49_01880 [Cryomyces minteri]|uniref:Zn(2)-C6 fungal-type domain-containing protein n=1 Tax=Cryomyces minteri TaxID=331657 RepID=A0A4U0XWK0_9PEZI|nr:hypothetical protein B0A49_01880 [Cryomyces minteri]